MMRALVYCRVPTKEQGTEDHYSLGNQEQKGRDYETSRTGESCIGINVASGRNHQRVGLQAVLGAVRRREIDVVIVYRLDRSSRCNSVRYDQMPEETLARLLICLYQFL